MPPKKKKPSRKREQPWLKQRVSICQIRGVADDGKSPKEVQEDRYVSMKLKSPFEHLSLFLVCDGHGGKHCAEFVVKHFPKILLTHLQKAKRRGYNQVLFDSVKEVQQQWARLALGEAGEDALRTSASRAAFFAAADMDAFKSNGYDSGTTLVAGLLDRKRRNLHTINLGDSRIVYYHMASDNMLSTKDHNVPERARTFTKGDITVEYKDGRVNDDLAMTHSIGDYTNNLTAALERTPTTKDFPVAPGSVIIVASDGLWDNYTREQAVDEVRRTAKQFIEHKGGEGMFYDNTTILYVKLS